MLVCQPHPPLPSFSVINCITKMRKTPSTAQEISSSTPSNVLNGSRIPPFAATSQNSKCNWIAVVVVAFSTSSWPGHDLGQLSYNRCSEAKFRKRCSSLYLFRINIVDINICEWKRIKRTLLTAFFQAALPLRINNSSALVANRVVFFSIIVCKGVVWVQSKTTAEPPAVNENDCEFRHINDSARDSFFQLQLSHYFTVNSNKYSTSVACEMIIPRCLS